ncbi:Long-chain-fatty-acid--CoA ligase 6 [Geranomyces variabilis]|uniref:Long-chain-fatty-acid--CoA ligase 6 n=1 Tax=Geranomyces variabilis TaxID=109894 RepID=A0AAD5XQF1_9FUNG|nr:Long-chain-fatty-acid--CoA ligase 6 [Geranomyces variabilis]
MTIPIPAYPVPDVLSVQVPNSPDIPGEGKPRVHYLTMEREYRVKQMGKRTGWQLFQAGKQISADSPFLGERESKGGVAGRYLWQTYAEVETRAANVGSALAKLGLQHVAISSKNCSHYTIVELAAFRQAITVVPIYDALATDENVMAHMVSMPRCGLLFTASKRVAGLISMCQRVPCLKTIVTLDAYREEDKQQLAEVGVELISFADLENRGAANLIEPAKQSPTNVARICYTSGTTGLPKGVIITHGMVSAATERFQLGAEAGLDIDIGPTDVVISYLPMAHVFENVCNGIAWAAGARIGFWQGDVARLMDDCAELRPTCFMGTPRIYTRIYDAVVGKVKSGGWMKSLLFAAACRGKTGWLSKHAYDHPVWDKVVFQKVRSMLGGRVRFLLTGAAPLSPEVADFLKIAFSCPVIEGYGMTEGMASVTVTCARDLKATGTVGVPVPGVYVKLVDIPEMNYLSKNDPPAGEVCFKGPVAFPGYFEDPEKTAETIDKDGWVHTGDIGIWTSTGHLKIIDRAKALLKLSQGEYVSPEKVEVTYSRHPAIESMFVTGNSLESYLVGVVNPSKPALLTLLWERGVQGDFAEAPLEVLCAHKAVRAAVVTELNQWVRKSGSLKGFEIVKNLILEPTPFSDLGLITPTYKLKRFESKKYYEEQVSSMYAEGPLC